MIPQHVTSTVIAYGELRAQQHWPHLLPEADQIDAAYRDMYILPDPVLRAMAVWLADDTTDPFPTHTRAQRVALLELANAWEAGYHRRSRRLIDDAVLSAMERDCPADLLRIATQYPVFAGRIVEVLVRYYLVDACQLDDALVENFIANAWD